MRHGERGQASVEVLGMLPLLLLVSMAMWQLHLTASASNSAENAARTASRVNSLGGDARAAALRALPKSQRDGAKIEIVGDEVKVDAKVPILIPSLTTDAFHVHGDAALPNSTIG